MIYIYIYLKRILNDVTLGLLCIILGLFVVFLSYFKGIGQYGLGGAFLFGGLFYLSIFRYLLSNMHFMYEKEFVNNFYYLILFISLFSNYYFTYLRPWWYFVLIAFGFLFILLQIFICKNTHNKYFIIIKIILLSFVYHMSTYYLYPTIRGTDIQGHLQDVISIISFNKIIFNTKYVGAPLWHLLITINNMIVNLNMKKTLFFSIVLISFFLNSLLIYFITLKFYNYKTALISVLLYNVCDIIMVRFVTNITPSSLVNIMFIFLLYVMIYKNNKEGLLLGIIVITVIVYTHQLSTLAIVLLLVSFILSSIIFKYYSKINKTYNIYYMFIITVLLIFISSYNNQYLNTNFFSNMVLRINRAIENIIHYFYIGSNITSNYETYFKKYDILSNIFYNMGYSILVFFSIPSILLSYKVDEKKYDKKALITYVFIMFTLIYVGTYVGLNMIFIPHRFLSFLEISLIPYSSYTIYKLCKSNKFLFLINVTVCFILLFSMLTTPYVIRDDPIYLKDRTSRNSAKYSEIESIDFVYFYGSYTIMSDSLSIRKIININEEKNRWMQTMILDEKFLSNYVVYISKEMVTTDVDFNRFGYIDIDEHVNFKELIYLTQNVVYMNKNSYLLK